MTEIFVVVQSLSRVRLSATLWTTARQASLSFTISSVYPNLCPSSQWCHPAISSSVVPFSSCPQSFPASGSFPMSQFFRSGGQSIRASASASVLSMNTQGWFPLGWTGWTSLLSKGRHESSPGPQFESTVTGLHKTEYHSFCWSVCVLSEKWWGHMLVPRVWTPHREQALSTLKACPAPQGRTMLTWGTVRLTGWTSCHHREESFIHISLYKVVSETNSTDVQSNPGRLRGYPKSTNKDISTGWTWWTGLRKAKGSKGKPSPPSHHMPATAEVCVFPNQILYIGTMAFTNFYMLCSCSWAPRWQKFCLWSYLGFPYWVMFSSAEDTLCLRVCVLSHSDMCNSLPPHGLQPTRLLCIWNFQARNTRVGCHFLLQGIFRTQGSNPRLLHLLHWQEDSLPLCHLGIREDTWSGEMLSGKTCCSLRQISSDPAVFTVCRDLTPNHNNYMRDQTEQTDRQSVVIQKITHNVSEYLLTRANNLFFITSTTFGNQLMSSPICPR